MKNSNLIDLSAINNVIAAIFTKPSLLSQDDKYKFTSDDFPSHFHKIVFEMLYNLYQMGVKSYSFEVLSDYLESRPKNKAEFEVNKGYEYLNKLREVANVDTFPYSYSRLKKMTLLRAYDIAKFSVDNIYNPDLAFTEPKKLQEQEDWLDTHSLEDIANYFSDKVDEIKNKYVEDVSDGGCQVGEGLDEFLAELSETPALGYPLYGDYINTVTRGARDGKFYLFSAATGVGKSRNMIGNACYIGCDQIFDLGTNKWISIGAAQPVLFIATEQDRNEVQSMCLAYISGVDEEHILTNTYYVGEKERIIKASQILKNSKIQFECMPDFTLHSIESTIKKHIREDGTKFVFFDYIHSSASILMEVGGNHGVKGLREDNVLFLLSSALKDIAVQYNVFIFSATQLNSSYTESETPNQNLLRGSKAIADRIDIGGILMEVTKEDKEKLTQFCTKNNFPIPTVKVSIYKNRQGRWKDIYLWMAADRGICRFNTMFVTDWNYNIVDMTNLKIKVQESTAF